MGRGRHFLNQADHRAVGLAVLDAARDAGNRWIFPELLDEDLQPWAGVTDVYLMGALEPTHAVDVTDTVTAGAGRAIGVEHAVAPGRVHLQGV